MAQHDMNIANQGFPAFRSDLNDALSALVSNSSGATAPTTTFAHQFWVDTSANPNILRQRNADNDAWVTIGSINQTSDTFNLAVAQGGTGAATLATNAVLLGNGTSAVQTVAPGTSGNVLTSNGTTWTSAALPSPTIASTAEAQAGTNNTNFITPLRLRDGLNASGDAPVYACRAWVNFNGTGTVAIRASGNVSSITDNGVGLYTVNFTTAMPDANYSAVVSSVLTASGINAFDQVQTFATSSVQVRHTENNANTDTTIICVSIFR